MMLSWLVIPPSVLATDNPKGPSFQDTREALWMDGGHTILGPRQDLATGNGQSARRRRRRSFAEMKNNTGRGWRMLSLEDALLSLEEGVLPQPSIEDFACILQKCRKERDLGHALRLHAYMRKNALEAHTSLGNYLVLMLVEVGSMSDAQLVFDRLVYRNEWSWNSLITGYIKCGKPQHALTLFQKMQKDDFVLPTGPILVALLKVCAKQKDLENGLKMHALAAKTGLLESNLFVGSTVVDMYAKCGFLTEAQQVFDNLPVQDVVLWTALITGYAEHGHGEEALKCFEDMQLKGVYPNAVTFVCSLKACGSIGALVRGREIHAEVERKGLLKSHLFVGSILVDMYAKCGSLVSAQQVFDKLPLRDVVSWTALIAGYAEHGHGEKALKCFKQMQLEGVFPNAVTFVCSLNACGSIGAIDKGQEIHAEIDRQGLLEGNHFVGSTLVGMYAKCGLLAKAQQVFDKLLVRDIASWTTLIAGYTEHGHGEEALKCFEQMQLEGVFPNAVTFICSLKACGSIGATVKGREILAEIEQKGFLERDIFLGSTLVDMYAKCGLLAIAQQVFNKLPVRDVVLWTTLIAGYAEHGHGEEVLKCFERMRWEGASPNAVTFVCGLKACGSMKAIDKGRELHAEIERQGLVESDLSVGNALVDMYAKCGLLAVAQQVFDKLPVRDVVLWTTLMAGHVEHGHGEEALKCFEQMQLEGVSPNAVTFICSLKACRSIGATDKGQEIHAEIERQGLLERDLVVGNTLVDMYAKCGWVAKAHQVFDRLPVRNVVSWNALIAGYAELGLGENGVKCFEQMQLEGVFPNAFTFVCGLEACASIGAIDKGQEIHAEIERKGLLERDLFIGSSLVDMYAKCGLLARAQKVFVNLPVRDVVSWTTLIAGYAEHGQGEKALECFEQMQLEGVYPNAITFICGLKACGSTGAIYKGQEIHAEIERQGLLERDFTVGNTLVNMYAKCGLLAMAKQVLDKLPVRDVLSWTALITGYAEYGHGEQAIKCFEQMQHEGVSPNPATLVCSLKACGSIGATDKGREIHAEIERQGLLERNLVVGNTLIDMYAKCGVLAKAQQVFDRLPVQDIVSWNALIAGYADHGHGEEAVKCFEQMQLKGVSPDAVTFVCSLKACGSIGATDKGREILAEIEQKGLLERDLFVGTMFVDMFAKCGLLAIAQQVFDKLLVRDIVLWTTLISGYAEHGYGEEALECFERMQLEGVSPNAATFVCCLKACGSIGATNKGGEIHAEIERRGLLERDFVGNTLIDMYAKCGSLTKAQQVFDKLSVRDVVSWTALMAGYIQLPESGNVFHIFDRMLGEGIKPDPVTFIVVLNACGRTGLFNKSQTYFEAMSKVHGITPTLEHHTCVVDLLGRAGQLDKAAAMIKKIPFCPNLVVWHSVLSASKNWGNVEYGKQAFEQAVCVDEKDAVAYVLMSHIYAGADLQENVNKFEAMRV